MLILSASYPEGAKIAMYFRALVVENERYAYHDGNVCF
ncbi:hypothetical protein SLEP1_g24249 [Rubroshorea leprosula]|nr:hypothetical protein SLEP1_g24249 [Rubroshorea leprosula]